MLLAEAGLGKSSLLEAVVDSAESDGFAVLHAKADELEEGRPFGVIRGCLGDQHGQPVEALLNEAAGRTGEGWIAEPELQFGVIDRIIEAFDQLAAQSPVALVIDDYQWIDEPSAVAVANILRRLQDRPVLTVIAARVTPGLSAAQALLDRFPTAIEHQLAPLADEAVAALVEETIGATPDDETLRRAHRGGGNPFLVKELAASAISGSSEASSASSSSLPETLQRELSAQFHQLSAGTQEVLRIASVIASSFTASQLAELGDRPLPDVIGFLDEALTARVVVGKDERLEFRHDLWREAIYASTPAPLRAAQHLAVGRSLSARGAAASDVAAHIIRGAEVGDFGAVEVLRTAAAELGRVAPTTSTQLLEHASRLLPPHHPERLPILVELIQSYVFTGELERSSRLAEEHLAGSLPPELELGLRNARTQGYFLRGDSGLAAAEFEAMLPLVADEPREAVVLADAAISAMFAIDLTSAASLAHRTLDVAARHDDKAATALARSVLAWLDSFSGDLAAGLDHARDAIAAAHAAPGLEGHRRLPHLFHAQVLLWSDDVDEARRSLHRGRQLSAELGMGWDEPMYQALLADERFRAGEWDDALAEAEAGVVRAEEVGSRFALCWLYVHQARIHIWRGDHDRAAALLDLAGSSGGDGGQAVDQLWHLRGLMGALSGDHDAASVIWSTLWDSLDEMGVALRQLEIGPDLVRFGCAMSKNALVDRVIAGLDAIAARNGTALAMSTVAWCRAIRSRDTGLARQAVDLMAQRCHVVDLARVQGDAASILHEAGQTEDAARLLNAAQSGFDALGAETLVSLHLRHLVRDRAPGSTAASGWNSLTRSERTVVELVSEGLSNAEIADRLSISRRTVESHLYHAYPKLEISNRVELALFASSQL